MEKTHDNPIAIGTTLTNLASARRQQGKLDGVAALLERALRIYEEQLGRSHSLYAYGLNNLASYYMATQEYEKAKALLSRRFGNLQNAVWHRKPQL